MAGIIAAQQQQQQKPPLPIERPKPDYVLQDQGHTHVRSITTDEYRSSSSMRNAKAIVLDLGSSAFRAGYSTMSLPSIQIPPLVARMRDADTGLRTFLIGHDAQVSSARSTARPAYEGGVPNNPALMERLLDGSLVGLGLAEEDVIHHRFVLTEAPCQPNSARALLMEILFEAYLTPGVTFGIDALFSYLYNRHRTTGGLRYRRENALILSCGYNSTHVLPLRQGKLDATGIKRINVGGSHMTDQLTKRLQLIHPEHANVLTLPRVERLKEKMCYVSDDFGSELTRLKNEVEYFNQLSKTIRIPLPETNEKSGMSPEEQERQRQARIENGKRLSEMMREKRKAKAEADAADAKDSNGGDGTTIVFTEEEVAALYAALKSWYELQKISGIRESHEEEFFVAITALKYDNIDAFDKALDERLQVLESEREKLGDAKVKVAEEAWWKRVHEDELLSMSDSELNTTELKRKRNIRALRGAAEARERAKRAKELEKQEEERKEAERCKMREERPQEYLSKLKTERETLAGRIKKRIAAREAGSDRRSQAARERMRLLAQHAGSMGTTDDGKGRTRGPRTRTPNVRFRPKDKGKGDGVGGVGAGGTLNGGPGDGATGPGANGAGAGGNPPRPKSKRNASKKSKAGADDDDDDDFGWNDDDWDVYRSMKVGGADSDSDDNSATERERLDRVRDEIREMDADDFDPTISHPEGAALLYEDNAQPDEFRLAVDRIRTSELLFQPTIAGIEQCGLAEAIAMVSQCGGFGGRGNGLPGSGDDDRASIVKEVFLTGGVANMTGLKKRLCVELRKTLPQDLGDQALCGVRVAADPVLDAWRGAALFAERGEQSFKNACVTRADYEEMGSGYLREHAFSNRFYRTPVLTPADLELKKKLAKQSSKRGRGRGGFMG